jgi:hypothetical protein
MAGPRCYGGVRAWLDGCTAVRLYWRTRFEGLQAVRTWASAAYASAVHAISLMPPCRHVSLDTPGISHGPR